MPRKKILFVAEAVTLAHVARALALAATLDPARFEIHFACADGFDFCFTDTHYTRWPIKSIPGKQFLDALAAGKPVYDEATLTAYVEADRRLLEQVRPAIVIGDFRLSLSVSARLSGVPYLALTNAYWSPHVQPGYTVPNIPLTKVLPIALADPLFRMVRPMAFAAHSVPLNKVRRKYGLPSLGFDLRRVYTDADHTAYMDIPQMFPSERLPANHSYLGPVLWSPPIEVPAWWDRLPAGRPIVYVTLGSSGQGHLLPQVLAALSTLPVTLIAATAGNVDLGSQPDNVFAADFLPGEAAAARSALVVCNGGSPTSQQALASGVPVLGIASNLDQFLNMHGVVGAGAGVRLRADRLQAGALRATVSAMLGDTTLASHAAGLATEFAKINPGARLLALIESMSAGVAADVA
jgi:UDP:flavonoid glycosyltransferase YjiC (YdhE family)